MVFSYTNFDPADIFCPADIHLQPPTGENRQGKPHATSCKKLPALTITRVRETHFPKQLKRGAYFPGPVFPGFLTSPFLTVSIHKTKQDGKSGHSILKFSKNFSNILTLALFFAHDLL